MGIKLKSCFLFYGDLAIESKLSFFMVISFSDNESLGVHFFKSFTPKSANQFNGSSDQHAVSHFKKK